MSEIEETNQYTQDNILETDPNTVEDDVVEKDFNTTTSNDNKVRNELRNTYTAIYCILSAIIASRATYYYNKQHPNTTNNSNIFNHSKDYKKLPINDPAFHIEIQVKKPDANLAEIMVNNRYTPGHTNKVLTITGDHLQNLQSIKITAKDIETLKKYYFLVNDKVVEAESAKDMENI